MLLLPLIIIIVVIDFYDDDCYAYISISNHWEWDGLSSKMRIELGNMWIKWEYHGIIIGYITNNMVSFFDFIHVRKAAGTFLSLFSEAYF